MLIFALLACEEAPEGPFALGFDGGEDCVQADVASLAVPSAFTIDIWLRGDPTDVDRARPFAEWKGVFAVGEIMGGDTQFSVGDAAGATLGTPVMNGVLHHLAASFDGTNGSLYIDGVRSAFAPGNAAVAATTTLRIGCNAAIDSFEGLIDEFRLSSVDRYGGEEYEVPSGPYEVDADTVLLFHFDEGMGETTIDQAQALEAGAYQIEWVPFTLPTTEATE